jgi:cytidylate kinase
MATAEDERQPGDDGPPPPEEARESPRHGFQGDRGAAPPRAAVPAALTIAVSREAGSRGTTIGTRAGLKLGWPVYTQDLLEYIAQEGAFRQNVVDNLSDAAAAWCESRLAELLREQNLSQHPSIIDLARIILSLGAPGEVVLIGRGAGCILPHEATLNVRIIAPLRDRIAYMSQWLRLTVDEAAEQVRLRDTRRGDFLTTHFHRPPADIYQYDLLLNSSLLGEDMCAELIVQAARAKLAARQRAGSAPPSWAPEPVP